jgi:CheY-like chemotaxis protein
LVKKYRKLEAISSSPTSTNEVKDYIFLKKLEVIYIDSDIEYHKTILNHLTDTIHLESCDSIYSAFELIEAKEYDVIICDMNGPLNTLKEFFHKFSQKIPILSISTSNDPKIAYMAAKMGAKDYTSKSDKDLRIIAKSIHKVHNEWVKETEKIDSLELLNDPNVRTVLTDLINTEIPITQRLVTYFKSDIPINDTIKNTYNIHANEILNSNTHIINALIQRGFIVKEFIEQTLACPNCKSLNIFAHYYCESCENSNFKRKEIKLHTKCGQIISFKKIHHSGKMLCSTCNDYFENTSSEFISKAGYQCNICKNTFVNPSVLYSCNSCNIEKFSINEGNWIDLSKFKLKSESLNKVKHNLFLLRDLEKMLIEHGFTVKQYEKIVKCDTTTLGPFELVALNETKLIVFIILSNDLQYNLNRIFEMDFASKFIDKEIKLFAISLNDPQEIVLKLLKKFEIIPIVKEDINDIFMETKKYL